MPVAQPASQAAPVRATDHASVHVVAPALERTGLPRAEAMRAVVAPTLHAVLTRAGTPDPEAAAAGHLDQVLADLAGKPAALLDRCTPAQWPMLVAEVCVALGVVDVAVYLDAVSQALDTGEQSDRPLGWCMPG